MWSVLYVYRKQSVLFAAKNEVMPADSAPNGDTSAGDVIKVHFL